MGQLNKIRIEQTGALRWDVYLNDQKLKDVRSIYLDFESLVIPTATIQFDVGECDVETECAVKLYKEVPELD